MEGIRFLKHSAKRIATELGYSESVIKEISKAKTEREIDCIMSKARHKAIKEEKGWY